MPEPHEGILAPWKVLKSEESFRTPLFVVQTYSCETPTGLLIPAYHVLEVPDSVLCACITEEGLIVIERQYRFPLRRVSMDYPAGSVEPGDSTPEQAALRELREETGYVADKITHLFTLSKDPGVSSGKIQVFLATGARRVSKAQDPTEPVIVELFQPAQILKAVETGEMNCSFCVATSLKLARLLNWA